ncbi:phytanoyl-CoA dioxygenase family protein [bacterium]|nr:phytanoyl-CoA dioxygenase family protein [bacterium]
MKNYFTDKTSMDTPWIESPFFYQLLEHSTYTEEERNLLIKYHEDGYIVIDLELTQEFIDTTMQGIFDELDKLNTQDNRYHYSDSPRVFEAWKTIPNVLSLARHPKILSTLELLYSRKPVPFQTINFLKGSNQPLHQDSIHFYTQPERWMVGTWTALQDMTEDCGPLNIVPGSHKWLHYNFQNLNLPVVEFGEQFSNYAEYENFLIQLLEAMEGEKKNWLGKKGQTLIWASNLLHGGAPITNPDSTRYAQATHFYFEGCNHYYSPMFSDTANGKYAEKNLAQKDILNHNISL